MAADAESEAPGGDKLSILAAFAQEMRDLEVEIAEIEAKLKAKNDELSGLVEHRIPDFMDELGLSELRLKDGSKVIVDSGYVANISKERQDEAFKWLRDNGHGSLIKHVLAVNLKKDMEKVQAELVEVFKDKGVNFEDKESVHASTLKAFVNEQMSKEGSKLPQELFGVFPIRKAKIK
jgi:hypothetical protein